jgi:hypothetical protein
MFSSCCISALEIELMEKLKRMEITNKEYAKDGTIISKAPEQIRRDVRNSFRFLRHRFLLHFFHAQDRYANFGSETGKGAQAFP